MPSGKVRKVAVIGAGIMGSGIAQRLAQNGLHVVLVDVGPDELRLGMERVRALLHEAIDKGILSEKEGAKVCSRIELSTELERAARADLAIEAVTEDEVIKANLFKELDELCGPSTILASNTSALSINELAGHTKRKDRFLGLHFFYPPTKNRLLEIIPGKDTSRATLDTIQGLVKALGMAPIMVRDSPGFAVNRLFVPWLNEATRLVENFEAEIVTVDMVARDAFDIGMGPFELMNATGINVAYHSMRALEQLGHFYGPSNIMKRQFRGRKPWDLKGRPNMARSDVVRRRLYGVAIQEACALLDEKVASIEDIERGVRLGLRWGRGPFELMNILGVNGVQAIAKAFYDRHPYLGMPRALKEWLAKGKPWKFNYVALERAGVVARIVVNRPEAMNAINEDVLAQLEDRFDRADRHPKVRAIVLEGTGRAFMAGADIGFFIDRIERGRVDDIIALTTRAHGLAKRIDASRKLVIAKIDGAAMGGGVELALVADVVVASERARLGFPETGIGLYPGLGGTQRLPRLVGKELAKYLIMTGRTLDARTAKAMGLVQYIVPSARIDAFVLGLRKRKAIKRLGKGPMKLTAELEAIKAAFSDKGVKRMLSGRGAGMDELAKEVSSKAPVALRLANRLIDEGVKKSLDEGLELELAHLGEIFSTKDALTGLRSVGKGRPAFEGR